MALKSADHIAAILLHINVGTWATDAIWEDHKDDQDYDEVALPDRATRMSGGMIMIERGRKDYRPNGKKLYSSEADFWKKALRHWPRFPLKKSHWTRDYRRMVGSAIERKFDLFVHPIYAITREENDEITSIQFFERRGGLLYQWTK